MSLHPQCLIIGVKDLGCDCFKTFLSRINGNLLDNTKFVFTKTQLHSRLFPLSRCPHITHTALWPRLCCCSGPGLPRQSSRRPSCSSPALPQPQCTAKATLILNTTACLNHQCCRKSKRPGTLLTVVTEVLLPSGLLQRCCSNPENSPCDVPDSHTAFPPTPGPRPPPQCGLCPETARRANNRRPRGPSKEQLCSHTHQGTL